MPESRSLRSQTTACRVRRVAFQFALIYLAIVMVMAFLQRTLIYQPARADRLPAAKINVPAVTVRDIQVETEDGLTLNGWEWTRREPAADSRPDRPYVVFLHGNGGDRRHRVDECELLCELGMDVLIIDYRGYGDNPGSPDEEGLQRDARAALQYAVRSRPIGRVIVYGNSLGGGVAVRLAARLCHEGTAPGGLILRSTFSSLADTAAHHYPWLPVRLVLVDRYPASRQIRHVTCPILQMHGDQDGIVPLKFGQRLFDAAPAESSSGISKRFVELPETDHNDVLIVARQHVREAINAFLHQLPPDDSADAN